MKKIQIKFEKLKKALKALELIYNKPMQADRSNVDATIQRFEFTFELYWKCLKDFFESKGLVLNYPRDVLQQAYADHLIENEAIWLSMLNDRNLTSHTYDEVLADRVFSAIQKYVPVLRKSVDALEKRIVGGQAERLH